MLGAALLLVLAAPVRAQSSPDVAGRRVAQTYCAGCHAVGRAGASPLADAPPFRDLSRRGDLLALLSEGMITTPGVQEEGDGRHHPRMPQATLDEAQLADFIAYLRSIQVAAHPVS